ncbi:hypothetical protein Lal_00024976 [Lupinus albus]|uniref:Putative glycosidase n=1 Tax=Lupinus albus TaxID=3870 RepID=A0A6A5NXE6_LUPAL|nr:putative glycosidase [Lupinus albus]KAF1889649.1 hypothetical protein Lal_00024976 [Lupinus albus]
MLAKWIFLMCLIVCIAEAHELNSIKLFNVENYGAISDGKIDNNVAFMSAWNEACNWNGNASVVIPNGSYMLNPIIFKGPCKGWTTFEIQGVLKAPITHSFSDISWINFRYIDQLNLTGTGTGILDGQGPWVWGHKHVLMTMSFDFVTNSYVQQLHSINSQNAHFSVYSCENMVFTNLTITAPHNSPNTDGIKLGMCKGININNVHIGTGDDCIAIISGTSKVNISNVYCGPGHGISVGSVGNEGDESIEEIYVKNCTFNGTSNGLRIKTWAAPLEQPIKASNFVYEDIVVIDVENPIIIDQHYCPSGNCIHQVPSRVQISNIHYKNIQGSCKGDVAVSFKCSETFPCQNIITEDIYLWSNHCTQEGPSYSCENVNGVSYGEQCPPPCI